MYPRKPMILAIDIETAPHTVHVWGLHKQFVAINQIMETGRVMCFAWRWINEKGQIYFLSELDGRDVMLDKAHELLDEADIVVTYNGKKFDVPTLNKEFLENGYSPPSPYKHVDLYRTARSQFRFASNKMDHLAKELGFKTKVRHSGHELWVKCMEGSEKAWAKMERYNKRDVLILEKLYDRMLPWIVGHPNVSLFTDGYMRLISCPSCGSSKMQSRGTCTTKSYVYKRFQCSSCGSWGRERLRDKTVPIPEVVGYA